MDVVGEQRVLLGVDVIGSASRPGHELQPLAQAWQNALTMSLWESGIGPAEVLEREQTGDGALLTLPHALLGRVVDLSQRLHDHVAAHNRVSKPEFRLRMAIDIGPVSATASYQRSKINGARLLDAPVFKAVLDRCAAENGEAGHCGLIVSDQAFRTAFGGDHTSVVREPDFAKVEVSVKEYEGVGWIRVPGFDARSIAEFGVATEPAEPEVAAPRATTCNHVSGSHNTVQAGTINGAVTFGAGER